jgi:phosphohistidine phosphatase
MAKTIKLLRHAKSDWDDAARSDIERPLAERGWSDIALIAEHMIEHQNGAAPSYVLCSPARRTRETLAGIVNVLTPAAEIRFDQTIYGAPTDALMTLLRGIDPSRQSVLLIGHNPGVQALAVQLAMPGEDADELAIKYPTSGLATLEFDGEWADLAAGSAALKSFVRPRDLR